MGRLRELGAVQGEAGLVDQHRQDGLGRQVSPGPLGGVTHPALQGGRSPPAQTLTSQDAPQQATTEQQQILRGCADRLVGRVAVVSSTATVTPRTSGPQNLP